MDTETTDKDEEREARRLDAEKLREHNKQLDEWFNSASPGDRIVYYRGRTPEGPKARPGESRKRARELQWAWDMHELGTVTLVQKKVDEIYWPRGGRIYEYTAIKR